MSRNQIQKSRESGSERCSFSGENFGALHAGERLESVHEYFDESRIREELERDHLGGLHLGPQIGKGCSKVLRAEYPHHRLDALADAILPLVSDEETVALAKIRWAWWSRFEIDAEFQTKPITERFRFLNNTGQVWRHLDIREMYSKSRLEKLHPGEDKIKSIFDTKLPLSKVQQLETAYPLFAENGGNGLRTLPALLMVSEEDFKAQDVHEGPYPMSLRERFGLIFRNSRNLIATIFEKKGSTGEAQTKVGEYT